jgi:hypothetical protein
MRSVIRCRLALVLPMADLALRAKPIKPEAPPNDLEFGRREASGRPLPAPASDLALCKFRSLPSTSSAPAVPQRPPLMRYYGIG